MTKVSLNWADYRLRPYERELAVMEATSLLRARQINVSDSEVLVDAARPERVRDLTYFKSYQRGLDTSPTIQAIIERNGTSPSEAVRRQSTRYSVHGLHEYKGKFNPQIARAILNTADLKRGSIVLDPFCGSGTTLVEAVHLGLSPVGADLNPLAAFIANTKIRALRADADEVHAIADAGHRQGESVAEDVDRSAYLKRWFAPTPLRIFEKIRSALLLMPRTPRDIGLAIASNLLREFSLQEPADLRIRCRVSPASARDPLAAFAADVISIATRLRKVQSCGPTRDARSRVVIGDARFLGHRAELSDLRGKVKLAITSPPYAMALPYIDTQRLSLVWLGLARPSDLPSLQSNLIGSREFTGTRRDWLDQLNENTAQIPCTAWRFCRKLARSVGEKDGFRRKAVPELMYRYLCGMREAFSAVGELLAPGARFHLIVGHNHTTLNGNRIDIDTPALLTALVEGTALRLERRHDLQTYQRYGLHQRNAVNREELMILQKG